MKNKLQTLLKHKLQWLMLLAALLGVSQGVWGYSMEKGKAITVEGGWGNSISTTTSDNNHYTATFYVQKKNNVNDKYWMKLKQDGKWYSYGGYWFTSSATGSAEVWKDAQGGNDYLVTTSVSEATSGYVKVEASIYVEYSNKSQYWITQTGVSSITANTPSVSGSDSRTVGTQYTISTNAASGGSGSSYQYQFYINDSAVGTKSTSRTYSWTPASAGTYSIKVRVYDPNISGYSVYSSATSVTITASCSLPLTLTANPTTTPADKVLAQGGDYTKPTSVSYTLPAATVSDGSGYTLSWSVSPASSGASVTSGGTTTTPTIKFEREGKFKAKITASCSSTKNSETALIVVKPGPLYLGGPFICGAQNSWDTGIDAKSRTVSGSNIIYTFEWEAKWTSSDAATNSNGAFSLRSRKNSGGGNIVNNYASTTLSGGLTEITEGGNTLLKSSGLTYAVGDGLRLTVTFTGYGSSPNYTPQYTMTLEKICTKPTVQTVSGTATICDGSSTNVTVSSSQSNYTYELYKDGSATATTQTGSTGSALYFPVSDAGTYTVHAYYTRESDAYCNADMSGNAVVSVDATSNAGEISGGSSKVCLGVKRTIKITGYTGTSIQWHGSNENDFTPDESTAIDGATNATYYAPIGVVGTRYYKAVVKNGVCTSATSSQACVTVIPDASLASATISSSPTAICSGSSATASITGAVLGGGTTAWSIDGTGVSINSSNGAITTTAASAGTVPVITYTITGGCGTGGEPISLSASPLTINGVSILRTPSTVHGYEVTTLSASPAKNVTWHIQSKPGSITTNQAYFVKDDGKATASDVSASSIIFKGKGTSGGGNSYTVRATDGTCTTDETFSVINDATENCN